MADLRTLAIVRPAQCIAVRGGVARPASASCLQSSSFDFLYRIAMFLQEPRQKALDKHSLL